MNNVVYIFSKKIKNYYESLDKIDLMYEYCLWITQNPNVEYEISMEWIDKGLILLPILYNAANTAEFKKLALGYFNQLLKFKYEEKEVKKG